MRLQYIITYSLTQNTVHTHVLCQVETNTSVYYSDVAERKKILFHPWTVCRYMSKPWFNFRVCLDAEYKIKNIFGFLRSGSYAEACV